MMDVLINRDKGYFDFNWKDGDIEMSESLDTPILMSIFCEVRAEYHEVSDPLYRRGWIGNRDNFEQGSKFWLYKQERITGSMLSELRVILQNGAKWLVDDGILNSVKFSQPQLINNRIVVSVSYNKDGDYIDGQYYTLWQNTGERLEF